LINDIEVVSEDILWRDDRFSVSLALPLKKAFTQYSLRALKLNEPFSFPGACS